jgi:hypothetical protein
MVGRSDVPVITLATECNLNWERDFVVVGHRSLLRSAFRVNFVDNCDITNPFEDTSQRGRVPVSCSQIQFHGHNRVPPGHLANQARGRKRSR